VVVDKIIVNHVYCLKGIDFWCLIKGLDRDGDGKVDDVEILE
jgi:hypothetical protein